MDTTKWRSVLLPIDLYTRLKAHAQADGRTLSGLLRVIITEYFEKHHVP